MGTSTSRNIKRDTDLIFINKYFYFWINFFLCTFNPFSVKTVPSVTAYLLVVLYKTRSDPPMITCNSSCFDLDTQRHLIRAISSSFMVQRYSLPGKLRTEELLKKLFYKQVRLAYAYNSHVTNRNFQVKIFYILVIYLNQNQT